MFDVSPSSRQKLNEKPILFDELAPFWEAFTILTQSRPAAFSGQSPIPLSEVAAYCDLFGFAGKHEREEMVREVRRIDRIYLGVSMRQRTDRQNATLAQTSKRRRRG